MIEGKIKVKRKDKRILEYKNHVITIFKIKL